jgi:hypothetical protein
MLSQPTLHVVNALLATKRGLSEPFLLAMFGAVLILAGDAVRHIRNKANVNSATKGTSTKQPTTPVISTGDLKHSDSRNRSWQKDLGRRNSDELVGDQLWLPMSVGRESAETNSNLLPR